MIDENYRLGKFHRNEKFDLKNFIQNSKNDKFTGSALTTKTISYKFSKLKFYPR